MSDIFSKHEEKEKKNCIYRHDEIRLIINELKSVSYSKKT